MMDFFFVVKMLKKFSAAIFTGLNLNPIEYIKQKSFNLNSLKRPHVRQVIRRWLLTN